MLGIRAIASHIPPGRKNNTDNIEKFEINETFLREKIGVMHRAIMDEGDDTSDLAIAAACNLLQKTGIDSSLIDTLIVITQNPDSKIPHVSALVHGSLGLREDCAVFDISLGCSGYVYGLSIIKSFMIANNMRHGILITADPYSKILDDDDRNTILLFGDGATATLISEDPVWSINHFSFGSRGKNWEAIHTDSKDKFQMDGRSVFNFAATQIPLHIKESLKKWAIPIEKPDLFLMHQGSRFIVKTIADRLKIPIERFPIDIENYGNTVSSSIPIILEKHFHATGVNSIVMSGFGVGLSWATCYCEKRSKP